VESSDFDLLRRLRAVEVKDVHAPAPEKAATAKEA
jgi:hypothetical protein